MSAATAHLYSAMVAGSMPAFDLDVDDAIVSIAGAILRDDRLHVLSVRDGQHIFYYAVPSIKVSHAEVFETPLAAALPGHPAHRGDGVYTLPAGSKMAAAVKHGASLLVVHDDPAVIDAIARERGLSLHALSDSVERWPLASLYGRQRKLVARMAERLVRGSAWLIGVSLLAYLTLSAWQKYAEHARKGELPAKPAAEMVSHFQYTSPLFEQLAHFQQISATVVRSGGWIEGYIWKPGKGAGKDEAFEIVMPGWISHDYVEALGAGTVTEYNIPDNLVTARKGDLEKMGRQ